MATTFRSSASATTGAAPAAGVTINLPAGFQPHDALIASITTDGSTSTITPPAGWTLLRNIVSAGASLHLVLYWRSATETEPANYTWTFDTTRAASGSIMAYAGASPYMPPSNNQGATTSASVTMIAANCNSTYDSGLAVQVFASRNTTAAGTVTPGGTYTKHDDVSTSASAFIGLCTQDVAKGLPLGGTTASNSVNTQAVTSVCGVFFLEDARPAFSFLLMDEYSVFSTTASTTTTASPLQTNLPNTVLLAFCAVNKDVATVSSITGASLNWVFVARSNTLAGSVEVWRSFAATPISAQSLTITYSSAVVSCNVSILGFTGADPSGTDGSGAIGSVVTGSTTSAAPSLNVTTTRNNSWVFAMANATVTGTMTAGASQTLFRSQNDATNVAQSWLWRRTALTPVAGTVATVNSTSPSTASCNVIAIEVLSAPLHHMTALGIG